MGVGREDPEVALPRLLEVRAHDTPDRLFAQFETGERWTYADAFAEAQQAAGCLAKLGLGRGEVLLLWLPNGPDFLRLWLGASLLGAIVAAPNLAYRGSILAHVVALTGARLAAVDDDRAKRLADVEYSPIEKLLLVGEGKAVIDIPTVRLATMAADHPLPPSPLPPLHAWDLQLIVFTSGTTGPSKGVSVPYGHLHAIAQAHYGQRFGPTDRYLVNLPMFHVGGVLPIIGALITGGAIVVAGSFRTDTFWDLVHRWQVTGCTLVGAAARFLEALPPRANDADNSLRHVSMFPLVGDIAAFAARFRVAIFTAYGMTEVSIPITNDSPREASDGCGVLRGDYEAQLVDAHDREVDEGEPGELVLRPRRPWIMTTGYWRDPQATAEAWRNGWFHTGDIFRRRNDGGYLFVDRAKDALRRRGENISSYEVESEILALPGVAEAAVIGVPAHDGEQEVMAVIVLDTGTSPDAPAVFAALAERLPRFMQPQYIRFAESLPRTPSLRVQKHLLRAEGVTPDTYRS